MTPLYLVIEVRHTKQQFVFIYPIKVNTEACDTLLESFFARQTFGSCQGITQ